MSISTRSPLRLVGGVPNSGFPNTGETRWTRGGELKATVFSGGLLSPGSGFLPAGTLKTADQLLLFSGAGRLNTVFFITPVLALSGVSLNFYDSAVLARSGGPFYESGYACIAALNGPQGQSGQFTLQGPYLVDMPFTSGLCVSAASGTPGFSISYTSETITGVLG